MSACTSWERREFLGRAGAGGLVLHCFANQAAGSQGKIEAIAFDGFAIFDPRPVFALVDELFPEKGAELTNLWRMRQFEYTWLRNLTRRYADFRQVTEDALVFAAIALHVDLTPEKRDRLMEAYLKLRCWPDVAAALRRFKRRASALGFCRT